MAVQGFGGDVIEGIIPVQARRHGGIEGAHAFVHGSKPGDGAVLDELCTRDAVAGVPDVVPLSADAKLVDPRDAGRSLAKVGCLDQSRFLDPLRERVLKHRTRATQGVGARVIDAEGVHGHDAIVRRAVPSSGQGVGKGLNAFLNRAHQGHVRVVDGGETVAGHVDAIRFANFPDGVLPVHPGLGRTVVLAGLEVRVHAHGRCGWRVVLEDRTGHRVAGQEPVIHVVHPGAVPVREEVGNRIVRGPLGACIDDQIDLIVLQAQVRHQLDLAALQICGDGGTGDGHVV